MTRGGHIVLVVQYRGYQGTSPDDIGVLGDFP